MRKHPMKVNVYQFARSSVSALAPMFPYQDEGAIVPCVSSFRGAPGRTYGAFQHFNTVDEIMINFGAKGTSGRPGMVASGPALHQVSIKMQNPDDENTCTVSVVTQRQAEAGTPQHEHVTFFCQNCQASLAERAFSSHMPEDMRRKYTAGNYDALETIVESAGAAAEYNSDADAQTCKKCGHVNDPFPLEAWGWKRYAEQSRTVSDAYNALTAAYAASKGDEA
jgi:hypothetical protein